MTNVAGTARLQVQNITKFFPGVKALQGVDFNLFPGEVHVLCGENGAGKSTLMHILAGNYQPDSGGMFLDGKAVKITSPQEARLNGIGIVYQERSLIENLSVAENIFANRQTQNQLGLIDFKEMHRLTRSLLQQLFLDDIRPTTKVSSLSAAQKQMIEVAKALSSNPTILILDEPTASITESETQLLFDIIGILRKQGVSIIYISHRMKEIFQIADRVTVLKDGKYQGTFSVHEITPDMLIRKMIGRDIPVQVLNTPPQEEVALEVKQLNGKGFCDISFRLYKGEILALAGLVGAGRTEIARAIFGADLLQSGSIHIDGHPVKISHPYDAIACGIGYLPEERKEKGLFPKMTIQENILSGNIAMQTGLIKNNINHHLIDDFIQQLHVTPPNPLQTVLNLSGGNQQKVVLAKWLLLNPKIFIADEPTHGIDVGAKFEIYSLLRKLVSTGAAILLISSELPEILTLADRILVICNGRMTASLLREEATEEKIMHYASGIKNMFSPL